MVMVDVDQHGGRGHGGQGEGRDEDHHGGQHVLRGGLGGIGRWCRSHWDIPGRKERWRRMGDRYRKGGCQEGCRSADIILGVTECWRRRGSLGTRDTNRRERRRKEEEPGVQRSVPEVWWKEGVRKDARMESGWDLNCSFVNVDGTSPGPILGRGAWRKLYTQTKLSFEVIHGTSRLVSLSTNQKRLRDTDSGEGGQF